MDNKQIAKAVIDAIGGRENVNSVAHCATRLRVMVKDESIIDKDTVENIEKVQGAFFNSGQYQIIFGTGTVNKIYDEVVAQGLPTSTKGEMKAEAAKQGNAFQRAVRTFGDVFVPIIPAIVATGLFMGLRGLLGALGITLPDDLNTYSQILTDTAFIALPALVVWSTFRVFGGNPVIGIVLEFEIHLRHIHRGIQACHALHGLVGGIQLIIIHPVGVRVALHDRIPREKGRAEQGGAHLAHPAAHAFDGAPADDDPGLGIAVIQADIVHGAGHREHRPRRHQQSVEVRRSDLDIVQARSIRAAEIRRIG